MELFLHHKYYFMKKITYVFLIFTFIIVLGVLFFGLFKGITPQTNTEAGAVNEQIYMDNNILQLPQANKDGGMSLNDALAIRRSARSYSSEPMQIQQVSQLLWSAQGINNKDNFRTAPSAGATFPLEIFVMTNNISGLERGIYHYEPYDHALELVHMGDFSSELMKAALGQSMIADAALVVIYGAVFERTMNRYGERGERYVHNEVGHASQNMHLQASALGLATVVVGAFKDDEVEKVLQLDNEVRVLYLMPVGITH